MPPECRYLLIVACSQRKRRDPALLPAIERYDGVNFRVLRKAKRERYWPDNVDVLILSAKYGFVQPDTLIGHYDLRMTRQRALALQHDASTYLDAYLAQTEYREVFINMGRTYLVALAQSGQMRHQAHKIRYATGGIGAKMADMKGWLRGLSS
jgi:cytoplasmic iron level regulating protein YaaA (DUF328/UPF0246 family)